MSSDHHHLHRPSRLSLPPRNPLTTTTTTTTTTAPPSSRPLTTSSSAYHPTFPFPSSTPTPTPSKHRLSSKPSKTSSLSFIFLLLFSLRSLYSLLPFIRSSPSAFSLFPFSFLVSLLSFLFTLSFNLFSSSDKIPFRHKHRHFLLSHVSIKKSHFKFLLAKSVLLAVVFLLRFQALKYCGTAALILAELSGNVAARFLAENKNLAFGDNNNNNKAGSFRGFVALFFGLFLLSISWDRLKCFPLSSVNVYEFGFTIFPGGNCLRIWPMLLPFLSGFLGCYEKVSTNRGNLRDLGQKRIRLVTLFFTTILLFIPAVINMFVFEGDIDSVSIANYGWPLANTVIFGVLLSENFSDDKFATSKDFKSEYLVTFLCTLVLELIYFSELSLWGLLICGLFLWIAIRELDPMSSYYPELGVETADSFAGSVMKPIRHILSERKSRKIALFLLINTAYMFVEFAAGFLSNSLGLISDACHMLFDCAALAIGLYASYISRLPANSQFNYGRGRFEVLSGYVNAVLLVLVGVLIVLESLERILEPQEISTNSLLVVSVGGLLVNIVGLIFFHEEHHHAHGGSCSHGHSPLHSNGKSDSHSHDHHKHNVHGHGHDHDHDNHVHHAHGVASSCSHPHDHREHHMHGDADSCSHGHSHSHSHDHHLHHLHGPDHHSHGVSDSHSHDKNLEHSHEKSCSDDEDCRNIGIQHQHFDPDHHTRSLSGHSHAGEHLHVVEDLHTHDHKGVKEHVVHHHNDHRHIDHNMEGIFLHILADTLGSVGVVVATLLIKYRGWIISDPVCSIFISILIVSSVIPLLKNSAEILLQRVPRTLERNLKTAINDISKISGVRGIQNLHLWSLTNADVVGTLHLHLSAEADEAIAKAHVSQLLYDAGIKDLTLQIERVKSSS